MMWLSMDWILAAIMGQLCTYGPLQDYWFVDISGKHTYKNSSEPLKAFILDLARILKTRVKIRDEKVCYVIFLRT